MKNAYYLKYLLFNTLLYKKKDVYSKKEKKKRT